MKYNKNNSFYTEKRKGKIGESAVKNYYLSKGFEVIDVSEDKIFQRADIDLIINDKYLEVKTQSSLNKSQKITLELETNYYDDLYIKGWFFTTEANTLVFFDKENNIAYNISTDELREIYNNYTDKIDIYYFDEDYKVSKLAYISIDLLKEKSKTLEILDYNLQIAWRI